jgi:peptidyl-prolyl cis-trans isomerase A (cyclophilin A)
MSIDKRYDGASFWRASKAPGSVDYGLIEGGVQAIRRRCLSRSRTSRRPDRPRTPTARSLWPATEPGTATSTSSSAWVTRRTSTPTQLAQGDNWASRLSARWSKGMEIVRKILALPTPGKAINPVMKGQILDPVVPIIRMRRAPITPPTPAAPAQ